MNNMKDLVKLAKREVAEFTEFETVVVESVTEEVCRYIMPDINLM